MVFGSGAKFLWPRATDLVTGRFTEKSVLDRSFPLFLFRERPIFDKINKLVKRELITLGLVRESPRSLYFFDINFSFLFIPAASLNRVFYYKLLKKTRNLLT